MSSRKPSEPEQKNRLRKGVWRPKYFSYHIPDIFRLNEQRIISTVNKKLTKKFGEFPAAIKWPSVEGRLLPKDSPGAISTKNTMVLKLGNMRFRLFIKPMVFKIPRIPELTIEDEIKLVKPKGKKLQELKTHHYIIGIEREAINVELLSRFLRKKGFPAPFTMAIPVQGKKVFGVLTEDLSAGGRLVKEIKDVNFSELKNGQKLKKDLEGMVNRLKNLEESHDIDANRHLDPTDPTAHLKKCFFVQVNPVTQKGRLVMGDLDHLEVINEAVSAPEVKSIIARLRRYSGEQSTG